MLKFDIVAYPNPFDGETRLMINSTENKPVSVLIIDISGRILEHFNTETNTNHTIGNSLLKGVYILKVIDSDGHFKVISRCYY